MVALQVIGALVSLVCWVFVLIKMFPAKGVLHGILAIICTIYAFIWGWMNTDIDANMRNVMIAWTVGIVLGAIGGAAGA